MATLNGKPGSITAKQTTRLVLCGKQCGLELNDLRRAVGGSLRKLSAADASRWITRFSGDALPNAPGEAPRSAYRRRGRKLDGVVRIITADHVDQIARLSAEYFINAGYPDPTAAAADWLHKNFDVTHPRELGTAERAGQVIAVLKEMAGR